MKQIRKIIAVICSLSFAFAVLPVGSVATNLETPQKTTVNEFDAFMALQAMPADELSAQGYSNEAIAEIKSTNYTDLVSERAQFSEKTLSSMGYTENEIGILKNYKGSYDETRAVSGTLTSKIIRVSSSTTEFEIKYVWSWDHAPIITATDAAGLRWYALDDNGVVDVTVYGGNSNAKIKYKFTGGEYTEVYTSSDSNFSSSADFNAITCNFDMALGRGNDTAYALGGELYVKIQRTDGILRNIESIKVCGVYGHTQANIGAPTVSFSPGISIGISFTGGLSTTNLGVKKYQISRNGVMKEIDA